MKFVFVLTNLAGGGAEKAILKTATALMGYGVEVDVVLIEGKIEYLCDPGINLHILGKKIRKGWLGKRISAWSLSRLVRELAPDIVVSTLPFADEVTALANVPNHWCRIANTLSGELDRLAASDQRKSNRRKLRYQQMYGSCSLIAVSQGVADDLRLRIGVSSRIEVIPNPFDFMAIREQAAEPSPATGMSSFVLHVGRFSPQKRHDLLLDAWAKLNTSHHLVLLTQPDRQLDAMILERGLQGRVHVVGFQINPYPWMAAARLLVLCSDHEGLPNVLIEALICGTPVVSTDCPSGPREILSAGLPDALVPCNDPDALAFVIDKFLRSPPDLSQIDLRRFSEENAAEAYRQIVLGGF